MSGRKFKVGDWVIVKEEEQFTKNPYKAYYKPFKIISFSDSSTDTPFHFNLDRLRYVTSKELQKLGISVKVELNYEIY